MPPVRGCRRGQGRGCCCWRRTRAAGSAYVAHNRLELDVAAGADVTRVVLVEEPEDAISIAEAHVKVEAGGIYRQTVIATGARLQRIETQVSHFAQGAHVQADGLYLLNGSRHADLTSVVRHLEHDGTTSQLIKGVARDTARGVFQGKIVVERGADGTDARMGHHALIASERGRDRRQARADHLCRRRAVRARQYGGDAGRKRPVLHAAARHSGRRGPRPADPGLLDRGRRPDRA